MTDHGQWRKGIVPAGMEHGAHRAQWFDDTGHRTPAQRSVAVEHRIDRQSGQDPCRQPQARPGVAAVDDIRRLAEPVDARRDHAIVDGAAVVAHAFHRDAERPDHAGRRAHVLAVAGGR